VGVFPELPTLPKAETGPEPSKDRCANWKILFWIMLLVALLLLLLCILK